MTLLHFTAAKQVTGTCFPLSTMVPVQLQGLPQGSAPECQDPETQPFPHAPGAGTSEFTQTHMNMFMPIHVMFMNVSCMTVLHVCSTCTTCPCMHMLMCVHHQPRHPCVCMLKYVYTCACQHTYIRSSPCIHRFRHSHRFIHTGSYMHTQMHIAHTDMPFCPVY